MKFYPQNNANCSKIKTFYSVQTAALPNHDPLIQGLRPYYIMGDVVAANCTSDASHPPANLTWFINDKKVEGLIKN